MNNLIQFIPFKSKEFISLISLYRDCRSIQRNSSVFQTTYYPHSKTYKIFNKVHREEKDESGRVLPAIEQDYTYKMWFVSNEQYPFSPVVYTAKSWYKNGNIVGARSPVEISARFY